MGKSGMLQEVGSGSFRRACDGRKRKVYAAAYRYPWWFGISGFVLLLAVATSLILVVGGAFGLSFQSVNDSFSEIPFVIGAIGVALTALAAPFIGFALGSFSAHNQESLTRQRLSNERAYADLVEFKAVFEEAARANQAHWFGFEALARDWFDGRMADDESVIEDQERFFEGKRDLMAAIGIVEITVGRLTNPLSVDPVGVRNRDFEFLWEEPIEGTDETYGSKLGGLGEFRLFTEELSKYLEPYLSSKGRKPPPPRPFITSGPVPDELKERQQILTNGFIVGATGALHFLRSHARRNLRHVDA